MKNLNLEPGEQVVAATRAHPTKLLRPAVILTVSVFVHSLLQRMLEVRWRPIDAPWTSIHAVLGTSLSVLLILVVLLAVLRPVVRWASSRFVLTNRRLMLIGGAAPKGGVRIPLAWLQRVETHLGRGPVGSAGIGTLSADFGRGGILRLTHSPRVQQFGRLIEKKAEQVRYPMGPTSTVGDVGYGAGAYGGSAAPRYGDGGARGTYGGRW